MSGSTPRRRHPGRGVAGLFDRLVRWTRMPPARSDRGRRFLVVQICGCSHDVIREATRGRRMPELGRLIRQGVVELHPVPSGLPTSTPAFQAGLMYGGPVDVPGVRVPRQAHRHVPWFPRPWDAAAVEAAHAGPGRASSAAAARTGACSGAGPTTPSCTFAHVLELDAFWGRVGFRALIVAGPDPGLAGRQDVGGVGRPPAAAGSAGRSATSAWGGESARSGGCSRSCSSAAGCGSSSPWA